MASSPLAAWSKIPLQRRRHHVAPILRQAISWNASFGMCAFAALWLARGFVLGAQCSASVAVSTARPAEPNDASVSGRPNYSGIWRLVKTENQAAFMQATGYGRLLSRAAAFTRVTVQIDHRGDEMRIKTSVFPPAGARKMDWVHVQVGVAEYPFTGLLGERLVLLNPAWRGNVFTSGLRMVEQGEEVTLERYMEGEFMVEHSRCPSKGIEMRGLYKKAA